MGSTPPFNWGCHQLGPTTVPTVQDKPQKLRQGFHSPRTRHWLTLQSICLVCSVLDVLVCASLPQIYTRTIAGVNCTHVTISDYLTDETSWKITLTSVPIVFVSVVKTSVTMIVKLFIPSWWMMNHVFARLCSTMWRFTQNSSVMTLS